MRKTSLFIALAVFLIFSARIAGATVFDFSGWDTLLKKYTNAGTKENVHLTLVKYSQLKDDKRFNNLIQKLEKFPVNSLKTRDEKLSFWLNVYNIMAIKMVVDHYPVKSIKDIGSWFTRVWNKNAGIVGNKVYSLNDIEHGILRKMGDPRVHGAIVCASVSCPDIAAYSFKPEILPSQLDNRLKNFLANETKGFAVHQTEKSIYISPIFKWFKKDFKKKGGVINFLKEYAPPNKRTYLKNLENRGYSIKYLDFNWNLNE